MPIRLQPSPEAQAQELLLDFIYEPITDPATGRVTGIFVEGYDVTERARAERALRRLNETLEAQVEQRTRERDRIWALSRDLLAVAGFDGYLKAINPAWCRVLGRSEATMLECPFAELVHATDHAGMDAALAAMRSGEAIWGFECRLRAADGSYRWTAWTAVPEGEVFYAIGRDITAEKQAAIELGRTQEQLRQAQKMEAVGQLTGGVAHDFNNLLQAVSSCLQMVERRAGPSKEDLRPLIEAGQQAVERGAKLVRQLMAFARREALRPESVDVRDRVLGMSELLAQALRSNITLETDFAQDLWPVLVDPTQLELALINLAVNARDAMPDGGRLRVQVNNLPGGGPTRGDTVRVSVSDTGAGMPAETLARAFEPFFTTKPVGHGSGLGLAQVYGFAQQSGGRVEIDTAIGRGTTVTLMLPRALKPSATRSTGTSTIAEDGTGDARVLLVEDDPAVASMVAASLRELGYDVAQAANADEALPLLDGGERVDVLISDVVMPGRLSGVDLVREVQRLRPDLPVVLATGYSEDAARAVGVRILLKPFPIRALVEAVEAALAQSGARPRVRV
jgi:PAS domain S-box-containing protein